MLEQELASIIKFVLDSLDNPAPYYWKVPQSFRVPSAYFPPPEIVSGADTLDTYSLEYAWYIKLFARTDEAAYALGQKAVETTRLSRNLIPLIDTDGEEIDGHYVRVNDPATKLLDSGACQLQIIFTSRRYYTRKEYPKMTSFDVIFQDKAEYQEPEDIDAAMEAALEKYLIQPGENR